MCDALDLAHACKILKIEQLWIFVHYKMMITTLG